MENLIALFEELTVLEAFGAAERIAKERAEEFGDAVTPERITGRAAEMLRKAKEEIEAHRAAAI